MFKEMRWLNEPPQWEIKGHSLVVKTGNQTDFWRQTFYEFVRDNGHFLSLNRKGDFTAQVSFAGNYQTLYDQAGLMLRVDERNWVKTGIEYTDGEVHLSTVITREFSDWSMLKLSRCREQLTLRLTRHGSAVRIQYLNEAGQWDLVRLGYLDLPDECQIGVVCCSPQRAGLEVKFMEFTIGEPISRNLHE